MKKSDNWNRFVREGLLVGEDSNVKFTFKKMSKNKADGESRVGMPAPPNPADENAEASDA